jgi:long-chain acyl-CoA synthetase
MGVSDKLSIFASTSREWSVTAYSCWTQNITITTAYDTLGPEGLAFSLNEGEVDTLFTNSELFSTVRKVIPLVSSLKNIIYFGLEKGVEEIKFDFPTIKFYSLEEVKALGIEHQSDPNPPKSQDIACIMYTSGSTGNPKGVIIRFVTELFQFINLVTQILSVQFPALVES